MQLTLCYTTCRKHPMFEWFADALNDQCGGKPDFKLMVVDFWSQEMADWDAQAVEYRKHTFFRDCPRPIQDIIQVVPPKPTVWQGPHRLTKEDFFAQSNCRNTALCICDPGYVAFVDDLSVPLPGWLNALKESVAANRVVCGAYRKVKDLVVQSGKVVSFSDDPNGHDSRRGDPNRAVPASPDAMYGCSCGAPLEAFLSINGYPELFDGMGYEDTAASRMIHLNGYRMVYDRRMMTYESQEHHHIGKPFRRDDPGISPNDKSHAAKANTTNVKSTPGWFGEEGIRGLRAKVRAGEPFPITNEPRHDWFLGQPLSEL